MISVPYLSTLFELPHGRIPPFSPSSAFADGTVCPAPAVRHVVAAAARRLGALSRTIIIIVIASTCATAVMALTAWPAAADFRICNNTTSRVGVALGYKDADGWTTEGWWNLKPSDCETLVRGSLAARYYYIYAVDYDRGGEWSGQAFMCTRDKEFTIRGTQDCLARGYDRTGFFEIDTGEQPSWRVELTENGEATQHPATAAPPQLGPAPATRFPPPDQTPGSPAR
jgi:uncharacterized membrane protein